MRHSRLAIFITAALILPARAAPPTEPLLLGVLEDSTRDMVGDPHYWAVRAVFRKTADGWISFPSQCPDQACLGRIAAQYPHSIRWTIAFDGKNLGQITGVTPRTYDYYSAVGQQQVQESEEAIPVVGTRSLAFAGWGDHPVYRPLAAISQPNATDPDGWKPHPLTRQETSAIRQAFRSKFPAEVNCRNADENRGRPWAYADANIRIGKAYASGKGWRVVSAVLAPLRCDGPPDGGFEAQTYVIAPSGKVAFLDRGIALLDAGDYDGDGRSELLFAISRYDQGGYELFYADFARRTAFTFGYH